MSLSKHARLLSPTERQANQNKNQISPTLLVEVLGSRSYVEDLIRTGYTKDEIQAHSLHRMALFEQGVLVHDLPELEVVPDTRVENDGLSTYFYQQAKDKDS
ncbi:hypothetical protein [Vibrio harveyi]|uniref:hypothetical protein n=1 Tax=Vibrio harveyi TaxID=669 RepID=UPI00068040DD|nr:hypothetical protein [Vibrio harveyi]PNM43661.1 hypothetical protein AL469_027820 [Vibrio harveyi]